MPKPVNYDEAVQQGLRSVSIPEISSEFDSRVLASLEKRDTWFVGLVSGLKPVFSAMCCSLVVTLAAIYLSLHGPISMPTPSIPQMPAKQIDIAAFDHMLDRPNDLRAYSLEELTRVSAATSAVPEAPEHRSANIRHACLPTKTLVS